jgi:tetratricopeptide (TPR) repeat protein
MKRYLLSVFVWFILCQLASGQLSYSETKFRDKLLNEGIAYIQQGEYERGSANVWRCLEMDSTYAPARLLIGQLYLEWGVPEEARAAFQKAQNFDPAFGEAYFYEGYLLYGSDTTGEDSRLFDQAISNGFRTPWSFYFRALTEIRDGKDDLAMEDLDLAIEQKEDFALAFHERAGIKRRGGDYQGAQFDYQQAIVSDPDFALAYSNRGSLRMLMGDFSGAIEDYSTALELDPELYLALNNRGYARYFTEDKEGALLDFNAAITGGAGFASAKLNKASLLAEQGDMVQALQLLDECLVEHPDHAQLYLNRGLVRELNGDLIGACEDWHKAIELGAEEAIDYVNECDH